MFDSTSLLVYTLLYIFVSACFVLRTTEFVSNGLTVENLFESFVDKEYDHFVMHHIKRSTISVVVHSCLPLGEPSALYRRRSHRVPPLVIAVCGFSFVYIGYLLGTRLVSDSRGAFVNGNFYELFALALLPVVVGCSVLYKWKSNNWANHPLSVTLSRYNGADWTAVARDISTEYQRYVPSVL